MAHLCARVTISESRVKDHVVHLGFSVSSSAHNSGYMVDGSNAMAAI